ncbi:MAG TPA: hypothetical protein VMY76_07120 [Gemmatimonadales bacterium]|nr:hypothetical protein [Gemmatimonadales bacterium]
MRLRAPLTSVMLGSLACVERPAEHDSPPSNQAERRAPADSLVATTSGGTEIWYTLARSDSGPRGLCTDRALEIRRAGQRTPVPLLYTGTPPTLLDDTTMRARLSDKCTPGDSYLVDLRTGRPVRERR